MFASSPNWILITTEGNRSAEEYNLDNKAMSPFAAACDGRTENSHTGHRINDVSMNQSLGPCMTEGRKFTLLFTTLAKYYP